MRFILNLLICLFSISILNASPLELAKGYQIDGHDSDKKLCSVFVMPLIPYTETDYESYEPYPRDYTPIALTLENGGIYRARIFDLVQKTYIFLKGTIYTSWGYENESLNFSNEGWSMIVTKATGRKPSKAVFQGKLIFNANGELTDIDNIQIKGGFLERDLKAKCHLESKSARMMMVASFREDGSGIEYQFRLPSLFEEVFNRVK